MTSEQKKAVVDGFVSVFETPDADGVSVGIGDFFEGCETIDEKYAAIIECYASLPSQRAKGARLETAPTAGEERG